MPDLCVSIIGNVISCYDAEAFGLIIFVLGSFLFFWNSSNSKVQMVQDVIHRLDEPKSCIWPFIKTYLHILDRWVI